MMLGRLISASILFRCERLIHTLSASSSRDIPRSVRNILIVSPISRSPMYISLPPGVLYYIDQKYICIVTTGDIFFIYFPFRFYTIFRHIYFVIVLLLSLHYTKNYHQHISIKSIKKEGAYSFFSSLVIRLYNLIDSIHILNRMFYDNLCSSCNIFSSNSSMFIGFSM